MSYLKVRLHRSLIGMPPYKRNAARALGLNKTHAIKYVKIVPHVLGNVLLLRHLLKVEKVESIPPPYKPASGYTIHKKYSHAWI